MEDQQIRFDYGASYERMMGVWSRLAGDVFLDWLKPVAGPDGSMSVAATVRSQNG